jgi:hypothetical protein
MGPRSSEEAIQLLDGPDPGWLDATALRALRCFGRIDGQQLLNVDGVDQGLAQGAQQQLSATETMRIGRCRPKLATGR